VPAEFGTYTNLALTFAVTGFGLYWVLRPKNQITFRRRAFWYWWCSWLVWVVVWALLLIRKNPPLGSPFTIEILVLVFDNLNTIFLTVFYFTLTRGDAMSARQAIALTVMISLGLGVLFGAFYFVFGILTNQLSVAYDVHRTCTLCLSVLTPILVGWALNLRFKNSLAFIVGCLYGFIQPIIYATELRGMGDQVFASFDHANCLSAFKDQVLCGEINSSIIRQKYVESLRPVVSMAVGLLKVAWAIICTRLLSDFRATSENLIVVDRSKHRVEPWRTSVSALATVLTAVYIGVLVVLVWYYSEDVYFARFSTAVGMITSVFGLWQIIRIVWKNTRGV
jgi:hypothetical protein